MTSLGSKIAFYRKKLSLTQEELAEKCSVTPQAVSKWENDISAPDIALIPVLAQLFGISCDELLGVETEQVRAVPQQLVDLNKVLLKIKVDSAEGDKVNLNLPIMLAEPFLKNVNVSGKDALRGIDFAQLIELVKSGAVGKIMEVNSADGDVVEIWVE
ncbi:MAG TPA: helix-turn-helix transcriptional regulator [Candidatus Coproplasma excrementavium]|nr:helix-turn-helix transcriptional regulator [Candidatus Coproplasma excrementavium]